MKKTKMIALILAAGALLLTIWFIGIVTECEYPYIVTIHQASCAKTVFDDEAAKVIADGLGVKPTQLNWHRCSYCKGFDCKLAPSMRWVQVSVLPGDNFAFAFDPHDAILYPADSRTRTAFPQLCELRPVAAGAFID